MFIESVVKWLAFRQEGHVCIHSVKNSNTYLGS